MRKCSFSDRLFVVVVAVHGHAEDRLELAGEDVALRAGDTLVVVGTSPKVSAFLRYACVP